MRIEVSKITKTIDGKSILKDIALTIESGQSLALIGPNGSGKSTLLKIMGGLMAADSGEVLFDGVSLRALSPRTIAQRLAFIAQETSTTDAITVYDAIRLGRTAWLSLLTPFGTNDARIIDSALAEMGISRFRTRRFNSLSGGEKQRVHIARARAQTPEAFLLDEPVNHLDIRHQIAIMDWVKGQGATVVMALHDLNHAFACDRVAVLDGGEVVALGTPDAVLVPRVLEPVFQIRLHQTLAKHLTHPILTFASR